MENNFLITHLLNNQDYNLMNFIYKKYHSDLLSFCCYLRNKWFSLLPLNDDDFLYEIYESIKLLKYVNVEAINNSGYFKILKKILVQRLIRLNRKYFTHKEKILTISYSYDQIHEFFDGYIVDGLKNIKNENEWFEKFNYKYDFLNTYFNDNKKNKQKRNEIFLLYSLDKKPSYISKKLQLPIKVVYNQICRIKNSLKDSTNS